MTLEIRLEAGKLYVPTAVCDYCGKVIKTAKEGNFEWKVNDRGELVDGMVYLTHKDCARAFDGQDRAHWYADELSHLPVYMVNAWDVDLVAAKRHVGLLNGL
jgi:hypothetical protein